MRWSDRERAPLLAYKLHTDALYMCFHETPHAAISPRLAVQIRVCRCTYSQSYSVTVTYIILYSSELGTLSPVRVY